MNVTPSLSLALLASLSATALRAEPDPRWLGHDRERPMAVAVTPATPGTQDQPGRPPSDATVLFDGRDASAWVAMDGGPLRWAVKDGALECVAGGRDIRTLQAFGDCQLHIEWLVPVQPDKSGQNRGNSGVFFGMGRYEVQVLDSYQAPTYADGAAGSVYNQYPPLVNASLPPGQWQTYDIIWTAPRFDASGALVSKARLTVLHNGVIVQNDVELTGPTQWVSRPPYTAHPERLPISLQDHDHPVRFRNIWVRELGGHRHKAFTLPDALLASYAGEYGSRGRAEGKVRVLPHGLLGVTVGGVELVMHAASTTHFYALTTDVQIQFSGEGRKLAVSVGEDFSRAMRWERISP